MIWKLMFWALIVYFSFLNIQNVYLIHNTEINTLDSMNIIFNYIFFTIFFLIVGLYLGLGWKKKVFSYKAFNSIAIIFSIIIFLNFFVVFAALFNSPSALIAIIGGASNFHKVFYVLINLIFYIPVIAGLITYYNSSNNYETINKPYWKLFSLYFGVSTISVMFTTLYFAHAHLLFKYNIWDYISLLLNIYMLLCVFGFSFNKKIITRQFWKVTAIPVIIFVFIENLLVSSIYKQDFSINLVTSNFVTFLISLIMEIISVIILYKYILDDNIWNNKIQKDEDIEK